MSSMDDIMIILHKENKHEKINILKETESISLNLFNDVINGGNNPLNRVLRSVDRFQHDN